MLIQNMQGVPQAPPPPPSSAAGVSGTNSSVEIKSAAAAPSRAAPTPSDVATAVVQGNRAMAAMSASLTFEIDALTNSTVVKIIDTSDNSVLRQIPSQEMLDIAQALDKLQGLLLRDQA